MPSPFAARDAAATPIWFVTRDTWVATREALPAPARAFAEASGFKPKPASFTLLPDAQGALAGALFAVEEPSSRLRDPLAAGALASKAAGGRLPLRQRSARRRARARNLRRSASRCPATASPATAARRPRGRVSSRPMRVDAARLARVAEKP